MQVIHQVEVQKRGGPCATYPSSCIVRDLLGRAGLLKPFKPLHVIDVTYGRGIFYYALRSKVRVVGVDPHRLDWVVEPKCFIKGFAQAWRRWLPRVCKCLDRVELVVVDPPWASWSHQGSRQPRTYYSSMGNAHEVLASAWELAEELDTPLLAHYREAWIPSNTVILAEAWFQGRSRYIVEPRPTWFGILVRG